MAIDISSTTRRIVYTGSAGLGPYAFNFEVLAQTDIDVYFNDTELTLTTDYTVTVNADGTGSVTIVTGTNVPSTPTASDRITIVGARTIERTTDFTTGGPLFAATLNDEFDSQTIFVQQVQEQADRALRAPNTDPTNIDMTLPNNVDRANKTLAFDSDGNPVIGEQIGDYRGDWAASTSYNKRDLVKDTTNDNVYICQVAHTSSGSLPLTSNADYAKWDLVVDAAAAAASASAAATSATNAANSASAAATSETNAGTSETNASSSATSAATSATNAATSETNASSSASSASTSAANAATSETNAATSATNAATSETNAASSASSASTSATNAATSATTATTQASAASTSATNAANSATAASTSETNAANSATAASSAQTAAETAQAAAEAALDNFDDTYLGAKASDPTVDNDGDPLNAGDQYFNTTANEMRVYNGTVWQATAISAAGFLTSANNLSDVSNASTSRTNLGLGSLAVKNTVATADIDADAIDGTKIADDSIGNEHIATDAVNADSIAANAVGADELNVTGNGTSGQLLSSDGDGTFTWATAAAGGFSNMQVFNAPGTFNATNVTKAKVTVVGGGGGGGSNRYSPGPGGGGGAGGTAIEVVDLTNVNSVAVTRGAGGNGGSTNPGSHGNPGGTSSFGGYCSATGGTGGRNGPAGGGGPNGRGGTGSGGSLNFGGDAGSDLFGQSSASGPAIPQIGQTGGSSYLGRGGYGMQSNIYPANNNVVVAADGYGAGGGGSRGNSPGGAGQAGVVIVEY